LGRINWTLRTFRLDELTDYYKNPRSLSEKEFKQLKTSLDKFGMIDKPIVNADSANTIIGGHQRKHVLEASGVKEIECWIPDRELSDKEVEELNIRLNKNTGAWDFDVLANEFELDDLLDWGFDKKDLDIDLWAGEAPEDVEPQIDKAEELRVKWGVESGQLWQLGEHRLVCGDCTDKAVVDKVMQGEVADLWLTDPPYGKLKIFSNGTVIGVENVAKRKIYNPEHYQGEGDFRLEPVLESVKDKYNKMVIWGGNYFADVLPISTAWLVWDKRAGERAYFSDCELAWSNLPTGARVFAFTWQGMIRAGEHEERLHPTQKPSELMEWVIGKLDSESKIILDTFLGSGTTLIACERLGRKCRAVEISPAYCAVAIQRWVDVTNGTPELVN
jgi:DNA modification methylase